MPRRLLSLFAIVVLITLGAASFLPAETFITRTVDAARTTAAFYAPGPIVEAEILNPAHPVFYGYSDRVVPVRWAGGPLLRVPNDESRRTVLMRFPGADKSVLSGLMRGANEIRGRPAVLAAGRSGQLLVEMDVPWFACGASRWTKCNWHSPVTPIGSG